MMNRRDVLTAAAATVLALMSSPRLSSAEDEPATAGGEYVQRWVIVDPRNYERIYNDAINDQQFSDECLIWPLDLGGYQGLGIGFNTADWEYREYMYFPHAAIQDGLCHYFDSERSCLQQLRSYSVKQQ